MGFHLDFHQAVRGDSGNWYRNYTVLGTGGNGVTFLVQCTKGQLKGHLFALKVFVKIRSKTRSDRFLNEGAMLKKLDHPSILRIYDTGTYKFSEGTYPFLVTTYCPETLQRRLTRSELNYQNIMLYSSQLLSALHLLA